MDQQLYNELNKSWKTTCRIVLGEEIGDLKEYDEWLHEYLPNYGKRKSSVSGKDVLLTYNDYSENAQFITPEEVRESSAPLNINEIKDIDSIIDAVSEKWTYVGNRVLGNSKHVNNSEGVIDSHYVSDSVDILNSSHIYSCGVIEESKYVFGMLRAGGGEFQIKCIRGIAKRALESFIFTDSSDIYYCSNVSGSQDLMFSFGQRNKRNMIGNLQLPKDKYLELKKKILSEMRSELKKNKRLPSIFEISKQSVSELPDISIPADTSKTDMNVIEKGFSSTSKILLKKDLGSILDYEDWLLKHVGALQVIDSPFGVKTHALDDSYFSAYSKFPKERAVTDNLSLSLSSLQLDESEIGNFEKIRDSVGKIAFYTDETHHGQNHNTIKTPVAYNTVNSYNCHSSAKGSEHSGVCSTVLGSKYVYGSRITDSQFCMNCYNCLNLSRCFEMDSCNNCSDSYFCHNCDGLAEAMFCWNAKAKRHAIGNTELPSDKYRQIKDSVLQQVTDELVKNKSLKWDIFNLGVKK